MLSLLFLSLATLGGVEYTLHELHAWYITISNLKPSKLYIEIKLSLDYKTLYVFFSVSRMAPWLSHLPSPHTRLSSVVPPWLRTPPAVGVAAISGVCPSGLPLYSPPHRDQLAVPAKCQPPSVTSNDWAGLKNWRSLSRNKCLGREGAIWFGEVQKWTYHAFWDKRVWLQ